MFNSFDVAVASASAVVALPVVSAAVSIAVASNCPLFLESFFSN